MEGEITLAIETTVGRGSLSLLENDTIIDKWIGEKEVSRSEELLKTISKILKQNQLKASDLQTLAVSRGPGSYTGARIGLATAIGLKNGLDIKCFGVSILNAFYTLGNSQLDIISAVSFGKSEVCWQLYEKRQDENGTREGFPRITLLGNFINFINQKPESMVITDQRLYQAIESFKNLDNLVPIKSYKIINAGIQLSNYIGIFAANYSGSDNLKPIYPIKLKLKNIEK